MGGGVDGDGNGRAVMVALTSRKMGVPDQEEPPVCIMYVRLESA